MIKKSAIRKSLIVLVIILYFTINLLFGLRGSTTGSGKIFLSVGLLIFGANIFLHSFRLNKIDVLFFVWFIWAFIGTKYWNLESFFMGLSSPIFFTLLGLNLYFFIGRLTEQTERILVMEMFVIGGILLTLLTIVLRYKFDLAGSRLRTDLVNANDVAYLAVISIFFLIYLWNKNGKYNLFFLGIFILLNTVIIFSASRKAFLGEFFFLAVFLFYKYKSKILIRPYYLFTGFVIILSSYFIFKDAFMKSTLGIRLVEAYKHEAKAKSSEERLTGRGFHYVQGVAAFKEHPIIGVGLDNINRYFGTRLASHSEYVSMFAETGVVGFLLYFTGIFLLLKKLINIRNASFGIDKQQILILVFAFITILLIAFGRWNYDDGVYWIFVGLTRSFLNR